MATYTDEQLANLRSIIASGVTSVMFDGKEIRYASFDDLLKAETIVTSGTTPITDPVTGNPIIRSRQLRVFTSKGF